jgi:hypothetical protein
MSWEYENDRKRMIRVTPQQKIRWFWAIGELPGTIFDDLNDRKPKVPEQPRRQQARRLRLGSRKRHLEASKHNESCIELKPSS